MAVELTQWLLFEARFLRPEAELLGERVDLGVLEQLVARHVHLGDRGVLLERALAGHLSGK